MTKRILILLSLTLLSPLASAAFKYETLSALQMETWRVRMGFHQLAVRGNAPQDLDALEDVIAEGSGLVDELGQQASNATEKDSAAEVVKLWSALSDRAVDNPLASLGYADFNAFSEINSLTVDLHNELQKNLTSAEKGGHDELLQLGVALLRMSSEYLALSTFPSAGINTGTKQDAMAFSSDAMAFEMHMAELEKKRSAEPDVKRLLATLKMRWTFIKGAIPQLDDPNAARVPLLFYRYSSQTAEDLLASMK
ncbi:MAG: hypothetical protein KBT87_08585 [Gammaproteobacteria bacterium]|nr:hypothetical protein [Gammaproteobacteria bacterium]MBQ0774713.1 hypothetical protein [Gammaproteobacteria bacterium]